MTSVRNNHNGRLTVAGVPIRPGATMPVGEWTPEIATSAEKALLDAKLIEVVEPATEEKSDKKTKG